MTDSTLAGPRDELREGPVFVQGDVVAGTYEVKSLLGSGGMGEVYEAHDRVLNRRVALKVVHAGTAAEYLLREGRALAAIRHPGVVLVHTMGEHEGIQFLVLERVLGLSLDRLLLDRRKRGEPFSTSEALELLIAIADALSVVHAAGLSHRDVKPGNVMLAPGGRVVLMDFGLVLTNADRLGHKAIAGSLQYMAPEALSGALAEGAGHLLDVYALGVLAYEILTGVVPFDGKSAFELYQSKVRTPRPKITNYRADVPTGIDDFAAQLMAQDPNERPQGAEAVLWQLRTLRNVVAAGAEARPAYVLIVDDDREMRDLLTLYVKAAIPDVEIETAADGKSALRSVRRRVPSLLLLDLDLPDTNGIEVCMMLRGMKLGSDCLIVSVSGRASRADVELLQQLGVRSLEKGPTLMEQLTELIRKTRQKPVQSGSPVPKPSGKDRPSKDR